MESKMVKNFKQPDERREFKAHGHLDVLNFGGELTVGRGVFEPGWRWSVDVKPLANTQSCEVEHLGYCISGSMGIRTNEGKEYRVKAGDTFHFPPGHDAWVDGSEPCVMLDFTGALHYAENLTQQKKRAA